MNQPALFDATSDSMKRRLARWKYQRRAHRLTWIIKTLGFDQAVTYGTRRGWIDYVVLDRIHLRATGRFLR